MSAKKTFIYAGIFIAGFIIISIWNFYRIIQPPHIDIPFEPEDFLLAAEDIEVIAEDGTRLAGWFIPAANDTKPKSAIIMLHGYPTEKSDMLSLAVPLHEDFALLLMDLRSFGESGGEFTTLGIKETGDLSQAVTYLSERGFDRIGVFGFSLGGGIALMAAAGDSRISAAASYASFSDLKTLGEETYRERLPVIHKALVELMLLWARAAFGESLTTKSPVRAAEKINIPVLIMHSNADTVIPPSHGAAIKNALSKNPRAEYYEIEGLLHGDIPRRAEDALAAFFEKTL
ncbi:alpha/beta fold hydrolase [bacterium]|nr:alpha/beta fold hydrolase [bacterium]MCI0679781.1 alpha/beta fold hydrolase [bacterium]